MNMSSFKSLRRRVALISLLGAVVAPGLALAAPKAADSASAATIGDSVAAPIYQSKPTWSGALVYGDGLLFQATPGSSGYPVTVVSKTPQTCVTHSVASYLRLVGVGRCVVEATQAGDADYLTTVTDFVLSVQPRKVVVSVADESRPYGASNPAWKLSYDGLAPGDTPAVLGTLTVTSTPRSAPPGFYPLLAQGGNNPNYQMVAAPGRMTVNPIVWLYGLPEGASPGATVDGVAAFGNQIYVPYGTDGSGFTFKHVVYANGELYVSTDRVPATITANLRFYYRTIPDLIASTTYPDYVKTNLLQQWKYVIAGYGVGDVDGEKTHLGMMRLMISLQWTFDQPLVEHLELFESSLH